MLNHTERKRNPLVFIALHSTLCCRFWWGVLIFHETPLLRSVHQHSSSSLDNSWQKGEGWGENGPPRRLPLPRHEILIQPNVDGFTNMVDDVSPRTANDNSKQTSQHLVMLLYHVGWMKSKWASLWNSATLAELMDGLYLGWVSRSRTQRKQFARGQTRKNHGSRLGWWFLLGIGQYYHLTRGNPHSREDLSCQKQRSKWKQQFILITYCIPEERHV